MRSTASFRKRNEVSLRKFIVSKKNFQVVDERWDREENEEFEAEERQISEARAQSAALDLQIEAAEREERKVEETILISTEKIGKTLNKLVAKLTDIKEKELERLKELQDQIQERREGAQFSLFDIYIILVDTTISKDPANSLSGIALKRNFCCKKLPSACK